jgi:hypothetical protein
MGPTQTPIQWVQEVKRPGRAADHSPPSSAEVKKIRIYVYIFIPPYVFMEYFTLPLPYMFTVIMIMKLVTSRTQTYKQYKMQSITNVEGDEMVVMYSKILWT